MTERESWSLFSDPEIKTDDRSGKYGLENIFDIILPYEYNLIAQAAEDLYFLRQSNRVGLAFLGDLEDEPYVTASVSIPCIYDAATYVNQNLVILQHGNQISAFLLHSHHLTAPFDHYMLLNDEFLQITRKNEILLYHLNQDILLFKGRHAEYRVSCEDIGTHIVGKSFSGATQVYRFCKNKLIEIT